MELYVGENGTSETKSIAVDTAPKLVEVLNHSLNGEYTILQADGSAMLRLLLQLDPETARCMSYNVLTLLKTEQKRVKVLFSTSGVNAAIGLVALNKHKGSHAVMLGFASLDSATNAHREFGASSLEESLKACNVGKEIYLAAKDYANRESAQII